MSLLEISQLSVRFGDEPTPPVVDGFDLCLDHGQSVAIVGESGSGKSQSMLALMGLNDSRAQIQATRLRFAEHDLLNITAKARRALLGKEMAMIFQDPMSALNPSFSIGFQIIEVLRQHLDLGRSAARQRALELLDEVEVPAAASRLSAYPHQLSGGLCQRVAIAMAIAAKPRLLIADEPTTALDVSVQAQILQLLRRLQREHQMALILISHDLAVVSQIAEHATVMYAGQVLESAPLPALFQRPRHPYTQALLQALPENAAKGQPLKSLPGIVPGRFDRPQGCLLAPRCPQAQVQCHEQRPALERAEHSSLRCFYPQQVA